MAETGLVHSLSQTKDNSVRKEKTLKSTDKILKAEI